jgi:hypothetical protein
MERKVIIFRINYSAGSPVFSERTLFLKKIRKKIFKIKSQT